MLNNVYNTIDCWQCWHKGGTMAGKAITIYNRLGRFDHLDRKSALYIKLPLLSTLWESKKSHNITLSETNKYNPYHGFIGRKRVKYDGEFFLNFNKPIATIPLEQDNELDFAILKFDKTCLKGIVTSEHMYMFFELIHTSNKNNHNCLVFVTHLYTSFKFIFYTCGSVPHVSIRLAAPLKPKIVAKPRHNQYLLIPGRVSTSGCACGGAFVLATKDTKRQLAVGSWQWARRKESKHYCSRFLPISTHQNT